MFAARIVFRRQSHRRRACGHARGRYSCSGSPASRSRQPPTWSSSAPHPWTSNRRTDRHTDERNDRRHIQDHPAALSHHHRECRPAAEKDAFDVHTIEAVEILFGRVLDIPDVRDPCIIDQDIESPGARGRPRRTPPRRYAASATSQRTASARPPAAEIAPACHGWPPRHRDRAR